MNPTPSTALCCPQCHGLELIVISDDLRRCAACRWLIRVAADGGCRTAFEAGEPKRRSQPRAFRGGK
jgi:hypothetical protein